MDGLGTRDRILVAATRMVTDDVATTLSVRKVAERAGVSTGSLRHFFPTQRALKDAVLEGIYGHVLSDDRIHERSTPARDRLVDCLRQILAPAGVGAEARAAWRTIVETFMATEPTAAADAAYATVAAEGRRRVEYWLAVLTDEGALAHGDNPRRARFLLTVLNGLVFERALPTSDSVLAAETEVLYTAVDSILQPT